MPACMRSAGPDGRRDLRHMRLMPSNLLVDAPEFLAAVRLILFDEEYEVRCARSDVDGTGCSHPRVAQSRESCRPKRARRGPGHRDTPHPLAAQGLGGDRRCCVFWNPSAR
jgi:hypothetical protein